MTKTGAASPTTVAAADSPRLLADVKAFEQWNEERAPALSRLEDALGHDFADRLVAALSIHSQR